MKLRYILICSFLYLAILIFDIIPLMKKKRDNKKSLLIYMPVFLFTLVINILYGLGVKIPSPAEPVKDIIIWILGIK